MQSFRKMDSVLYTSRGEKVIKTVTMTPTFELYSFFAIIYLKRIVNVPAITEILLLMRYISEGSLKNAITKSSGLFTKPEA